MVVPEASINNIMGGLENTTGVRLHNHRRKLKQRFDIVRKLGQGTYGKVQLGINKETGQEVAIKTIKKCKIETEADLVRIRREIQIMSSVQHPNIIHIYEVFENREKMVLVMEYAAGGELYDYLSEKKVLDEGEARRIFRQIATAIYYCHKHKICHRDLKLENVLLDEHGSAKIADFGLSNVFDDCRLLGTFCGSPLYASPEIVKGTPYHGPEVDCWSLGVLLYTLVYGAMPFDGSNFKRLVRQISQGDYFEPKKPSPASPLIKEMLNINAGRRADITSICSHWWVDEGQSESCLDIAEELANQTPVRLDLLLSLAPPAISNDNVLISDQGVAVETGLPGCTERPLRSHSLGSISTTNQLEFIPELQTSNFQNEKEVSATKKPSNDTQERRKERSRSSKRDRSSSRSRSKHREKHHDDSTSDVSSAENTSTVKPHRRKSTKSSHSKKSEGATATTGSVNKEVTSETGEKVVNEMESVKQDVPVADTVKENTEKNVKEVEKKEEVEVTKEKDVKVEDNVNIVKDTNEEVIVKESEKIKENQTDTKPKTDSESPVKPLKKVESPKETKMKSKEKEKSKTPDEEKPSKPIERRRSKIFETAEKFNNIQSLQDNNKPPPKKVFLPGVKVSDATKAYERKSSLVSSSSFVKPNLSRRNSSVEPSSPSSSELDRKFSLASTVALHKLVEDVEKLFKEQDSKAVSQDGDEKKENVELDKTTEMENKEKISQIDDESKEKEKMNDESKKLKTDEKIESIPDEKSLPPPPATPVKEIEKKVKRKEKDLPVQVMDNAVSDISEKKAATLPRRKTSRAEIKLATPKQIKPEFRSEVEHMVAAAEPPYQQRSEVIFPVAAATPQEEVKTVQFPVKPMQAFAQPQSVSKSLPTVRQESQPREHIIPIRFEEDSRPLPKPPHPVTQRPISRTNSQSLSRQSTQDSDSGSVTSQGEPIRKSPREVIIPIAVEGGGYVTPSVDAITRMSSLNESESELSSRGFGLHSARRPKKQLETADSISSDEDDDNFEILTAENLFSTLLSRVRNLTHRLNSDENRTSAFPRLFNHNHSLFENSPSRRLAEARSFTRNDIPWRRSMSRDTPMSSTSSSTLPRVGVRVTLHTPSRQDTQ